ncbi:MAG: class II aldolase/adducin family protein [Candidatus Obscuribacterales bacterium]|nr:class II aldolase/adducin family protein [Candidatus Obscuribacterales bacterium]
MASAEKDELYRLCAYAGERFDLSQAGGGNVSCSFEGDSGRRLAITASGWALSDVKDASALCELDHSALADALDLLGDEIKKKSKGDLERWASAQVAGARFTSAIRPSIETLMHAAVGGAFILHTHPIAVNALLCRRDWRGTIESLFPDAFCVGYTTPGVNLAQAVSDAIAQKRCGSGKEATSEKIIFLENHGLIVAATNVDRVIALTGSVLEKIERHLGLDLSRFRITNRITRLVREATGQSVCSYLCEDELLNEMTRNKVELVLSRPTWPDQLVYCGAGGLHLKDLDDRKAVQDFIAEYTHTPRIIVHDNKLVFVERSLKNCQRIEDVLKAHVMMLMNSAPEDIQYLSDEEQRYLLNWEAEKVRQAM